MKVHLATVTVLMIVLFSTLRVQANEPGWSDVERAAQSDAVFTGTVQSVQQVRELNEHENLLRATVQVQAVQKNHDLLAANEITLYFAGSKDGASGRRCPAPVELSEKQSATFYVRVREIGKEKLPFLAMGSDVRQVPKDTTQKD